SSLSPPNLDCASPSVHCVDDTMGPNQEFATVQEAADVAAPGDVIVVFDGSYHYCMKLGPVRQTCEERGGPYQMQEKKGEPQRPQRTQRRRKQILRVLCGLCGSNPTISGSPNASTNTRRGRRH